MARSVSLGVEPLSIIDLSYAIGRRLWLMAASLARSTTALAESGTTTMASPALTVKAGRQRGSSVLERQRKEEELQLAAEAAAAAKRRKRCRRENKNTTSAAHAQNSAQR